jgi:hypothetical protein
MSDQVVISFPNWKRSNATPIDKLRELLEYAERHPEDVNDLILIWHNEQGIRCAECSSGLLVSEMVYSLEQAKFDLLKEM